MAGETYGMMCPHCGALCGVRADGLTISHSWPKPTRQVCPGSGQTPRYAYSDARPLWNGEANPHLAQPAPNDGSAPMNS